MIIDHCVSQESDDFSALSPNSQHRSGGAPALPAQKRNELVILLLSGGAARGYRGRAVNIYGAHQ